MKNDDPAYKEQMSDIARIKKSFGFGGTHPFSPADQKKSGGHTQEFIKLRKEAIAAVARRLLDGSVSLQTFLREASDLNDSDLENETADDLIQLIVSTYLSPNQSEPECKDGLIKIRRLIDGLES